MYQKLPKLLQKKVETRVRLFVQEPFAPSLKNHALKGKYKDQRSISVTEDLRIVFAEKEDYVVVILILIGTHSQLYL